LPSLGVISWFDEQLRHLQLFTILLMVVEPPALQIATNEQNPNAMTLANCSIVRLLE